MPQDPVTKKLYCDFTLITKRHPEAVHHPAWESFKHVMDGHAYGWDPLNQAWHFFSAGWDAKKPIEPDRATGVTEGMPEQPDEAKWAETWSEP